MGIVEQMRSFESDHEPDGWPAIQMKQVSALCDEIDRLRAEIDAANAQQSPAVAVPDGWILVPKMLTKKMYDAIVRVADNRDFISWPANIWESACDASPNPPTSKLLRVTEYDAREIALSAWRYCMNNFERTVDNWIEDDGRDLINKLSGTKNETN